MTIPVWISSPENPDAKILTHAPLDTQSNTSFIANDLASDLKATPELKPGELQMSTMTSQNKQVFSSIYSGLNIRGFSSAKSIQLSKLYSCNHIPFSACSVPLPKDELEIEDLSHIAHFMSSKVKCKAGLLIGYDHVEAIAPLEVFSKPESHAYAHRTVLGWCVVGPANKRVTDEMADQIGFSNAIQCHPIPEQARHDVPSLKSENVLISHHTIVNDIYSSVPINEISEADFKSAPNQTRLSQDVSRGFSTLQSDVVQQPSNYTAERCHEWCQQLFASYSSTPLPAIYHTSDCEWQRSDFITAGWREERQMTKGRNCNHLRYMSIYRITYKMHTRCHNVKTSFES